MGIINFIILVEVFRGGEKEFYGMLADNLKEIILFLSFIFD